MSFMTCRLADVITLKRGHDLPDSVRQSGDVPVVSSSGITGYHSEAKANAPGVVTGRYGTLGEVYYIESAYWPLNTALYVVDFKGNHPRFVSYFLQNLLQGYQSDKAAVPGVNRNVLHELRVRLPDSGSQGKIAGILSAYDDLIENNRRRMALLDEAARQLYREWFVRMRFPGREHTPVVGGVPRGWERRRVADLTSLLRRGIAPSYDDDADGLVLNQKCIRDGRIDLSRARFQSRELKPELQIRPGDVLVNSTGEGTLGRVAQLFVEIPNCTVDSHVTIVRPKSEIGVTYFGQSLVEWSPRFSTMGRGATNQTELSSSQIGSVEILWPPGPLLQEHESFAAPIARQIATLVEQNTKLRDARDLLLPRLMSGEISV